MTSFRLLGLVPLFACSFLYGWASAPTVDLPTANPSAIHVQTPTPVMIRTQITSMGSAVISGSVNVLKTDQAGKTIGILGSLNDDGVDPDLTSGDGVFSGSLVFDEPAQGRVYLRVSAAFKGVLRRSLSPVFSIEVVPSYIPTSIQATPDATIVADSESGQEYVCNQLLLRAAAGADYPSILSAVESAGGTLLGYESDLNLMQVQFPTCAFPDLVAARDLLRSSVYIESIGLNGVSSIFQGTSPGTSDPLFGEQWSLTTIRAPEAWALSPTAARVAVVDTGVNRDHEDLIGRVMEGKNTADDNGDTTPLDGHGTAIAGLIAAIRNNGIGVAGAASHALIVPERAARSDLKIADTAAALGIRDAINRGAKAINLSFGARNNPKCSGPENDCGGVFAATVALRLAMQNNVAVVAAAGNAGNTEKMYPAAFHNYQVISVGASDQNDKRALWSEDAGGPCGAISTKASNYGSWVDVYAPGTDIEVLRADVSLGPSAYDSVCDGGTSYAAPLVTATAAMMLAANPDLSPAAVREIIRTTARVTANKAAPSDDPDETKVAVLDAAKAVSEAIRRKTQSNLAPAAGFTMSSGRISRPQSDTLAITAPKGGTATVLLDGAPPFSYDQDGIVTDWAWSVNGAPVSALAKFSRTFAPGTYDISLVVTDNANARSSAATAKIVVAEDTLFTGSWVTENSNSFTRMQFRTDSQNIFVHLWGKCTPIDCDWHENSTPAADGSDGMLSLVWSQGFATRIQEITSGGDGKLKVVTRVHYTDGSGRQDFETIDYFQPGGDPLPQAGFFIDSGGKTVYSDETVSITGSVSGAAATFHGVANTYEISSGKVTLWEWTDNGGRIPDPSFSADTFTFQLTPGAHNIALVVTDTRGLRSTPATASITVAEPSPLTAGCYMQPDPITLGEGTTVYAQCNGGVPPYEYKMSSSLPFGNVNSLAVMPSSSGIFTYSSVEVKDSVGGIADASCQAVVNAPSALAASCTANGQSSPLTLEVGSQATFAVNASGGIVPLHYQWSGINGNDSSAALAIYSSPGTYDVSVVVTDSTASPQRLSAACPRVTVTVPPALSVYCSVSPNPADFGTGATLSAGAVGGLPPYQFLLPGGSTYSNNSTTVVLPQEVGTASYQVTGKDSNGQTGTGTCSVQVRGVAPTITTYGWYSQPRNRIDFSGYINGTGFVPGAAVWFCIAGTTTCYQHPPAGVVVNSPNSIGITSANLTTGNWQVEVRTPYGNATSSGFVVNP